MASDATFRGILLGGAGTVSPDPRPSRISNPAHGLASAVTTVTRAGPRARSRRATSHSEAKACSGARRTRTAW